MKKLIILSTLMIITGCATDYPCGEPRAGRCSSVSDNIQKSNQPVTNPEDLPINPYENCANGKCTVKNSSNTGFSQYPQLPANGSPLVSTPSMMRVWIAPYIDTDNIYHEQNYQYMLVDRGRWLYGTNKVFGRNGTNLGTNTTLVQDTNSVVSNNTNSTSNTAQQANQNTANATPALNYLKQQDQATISSMGIGK